MCNALAGLIIKNRLVTHESGIVHSHEELFKRAFPLEESRERARLEDNILAWECYPQNHYHPDGSGWFDIPVESWRVHIEKFFSMELVEDEVLASRIRAEARKWRRRFVADVGDSHVAGGVFYLLRCNGASLSNVAAERVVGHAKSIEASNIGVCNADIESIVSSTIRRLYGYVGLMSGSCVLHSAYSSFGHVEDSRISALGGHLKYVKNSIVGGSPLIYQQKDCLTLTQS